MTDDRREAPRFEIAADIEASVSGVRVRIIELSAIGARIEHADRFPLLSPEISISWRGKTMTLPVRVARSEIAGRTGANLHYRSGIYFVQTHPASDNFIATIIGQSKWAARESTPAELLPPPPATAPVSPPPPPPPADAPQQQSLDDSWIRRVNFMREDPDDNLPYAQFRLTPHGWEKTYVASPAQPEDGFTIRRGQKDFTELQQTFERADGNTRRMLQSALKAKLETFLVPGFEDA